MKVKTSLLAIVALGGTALIGAHSNAGADPQAQSAVVKKVTAQDNFFSPVKAVIAKGDKVKWTNTGKVAHNVTFPDGFKSGNFSPGESTVAKFNRAGKFPYTCTIHPGMNGKVKVSG
jgi:plastocyanin